MMGIVGNALLATLRPTKHGHGTGPYHLRDPQGQGGFKDVDGALAIHLQRAQWVCLTTNAQGRGEVHDALCLRLMHRAQDKGQIGHITAHHAYVVSWRSAEDVSQELTIWHQVEDSDLMSSFAQSAHSISPNKTRAAG